MKSSSGYEAQDTYLYNDQGINELYERMRKAGFFRNFDEHMEVLLAAEDYRTAGWLRDQLGALKHGSVRAKLNLIKYARSSVTKEGHDVLACVEEILI